MNPLDELNSLVGLFDDEERLIEKAEHIPPAIMPEAYQKMLAHNHHMTVTMESYYDSPVDVQIFDKHLEGDLYTRKITLTKTGTNQVVQFGIVRFKFQYVTEAVRDQILAGEIPLGRVLINHNVLRHIDLGAILKITAGPGLAKLLQMQPGEVTYGRLATIFCNQQPAVDLLEIAAPLET